MAADLPSAIRITMKPPPPMLPACGNVTASAKPVATAASTAFPPARMISTPAWLASALLLTTMPCAAIVACLPKPTVQSAGKPIEFGVAAVVLVSDAGAAVLLQPTPANLVAPAGCNKTAAPASDTSSTAATPNSMG